MSDTDQSSVEVELDECYICKDTTGTLFRPCTNKKCRGRIHPKCLEEQYASKNDNCGICKEPIYITVKKQTFDTGKCIKTNLKILYIGLILLGGPVIITLLMLGKSVSPDYNNTIYKCDQNFALLHPFSGALLIAIFFRIPRFSQPCLYKNTPIIGNALRNMKYRSYIIQLILFGISCILVLGAQLIGYFVSNNIYNIHAYFDCVTYAYGIIVYGIIIGIVTVVIAIIIVVHKIYQYNVDNFSLKELEFGVSIDNAEGKYLLHKQ